MAFKQKQKEEQKAMREAAAVASKKGPMGIFFFFFFLEYFTETILLTSTSANVHVNVSRSKLVFSKILTDCEASRYSAVVSIKTLPPCTHTHV
jgi:hypothetical protein